jgi:hypothetical protein
LRHARRVQSRESGIRREDQSPAESRVSRRGLIAKSAAGVGLAAAAAAAMLLLVPASAQANAPRVTRGDAQAILQAQGNGGWAVILNGGIVEEGAPSDFMFDSMARIAPQAGWNGRHFCSLDWHVINVPAVEGNAVGRRARTRRFVSSWRRSKSTSGWMARRSRRRGRRSSECV